MPPHHPSSLALAVATLGIAIGTGCASPQVAQQVAQHAVQRAESSVELGTDALRPHVAAVTPFTAAGQRLTVDLPREGYVTVLAVQPGAGMLLLAPAGVYEATVAQPGRHQWSLRPTAVPLPVTRTAGVNSDAPPCTTPVSGVCPPGSGEPRYLERPYTVVFVTSTPLSWNDVSHRLMDVSVVGEPRAVLDRVATALGARSSWAATAVQASMAMTSQIPPFGR